MKLTKLKEIIDKAVVNAAGCDVDVFVLHKGTEYKIHEITQFNVIPKVHIETDDFIDNFSKR
jgi:hypothetical protein